VLTSVTVALILGLIAAPADAAWQLPAFDLSATLQNADVPQVAVDGAGNAQFVWQRPDGDTPNHMVVQTRRRAADGTLGPVQDLHIGYENANLQPQVAFDGAGNARFVWTGDDGTYDIIQTRRLKPDGSFEPLLTAPPIDVSETGQNASEPQVAFDSSGNAHFVWTRSDGSNFLVQTRKLGEDGTTLGTVQDLSATGTNAESPQVAVDSSGNAHFVWLGNSRAQTRRLEPDGSFDPPLTTDPLDLSAGGIPTNPQVAVDGAGTAHFVWELQGGTHDVVQTRRRDADGTLEGAAQNVSDPDHEAGSSQVAVDGAGNARFVWIEADGTTNKDVVKTRQRAAGTPFALGVVQDLSDSSQSASLPQLAVDGAGNAHFVWIRFDGTDDIVQARQRAADGSLSLVEDLSATGAQAYWPQVAVDGAGNATAVWVRRDPTYFIVQGAVNPIPPPPPSGGDGSAPFPAPVAGPTGQRAGALQRCKRKYKKALKSKRAHDALTPPVKKHLKQTLRKCKRRANQLPV
jgi:microcompartment protein CcmK/EutM